MLLERVSNCCRLSGCLLASMMGLDNLLLKRLSVRMFSQSLFTSLKKVAMDGWMELCNEGETFFISILVGITCQGFGLYDV